MTYGEQVRHPNGALNPGAQDKRQSWPAWFWVLLGLAALAWFAWRVGWLDKILASGAKAVSAVKPIPNPHGWV